MIEDELLELDKKRINVLTNNQKLKSRFEEFYSCISNGNAGAAKIVFVDGNEEIKDYDKTNFYIQFIDNDSNKLNNINSYVYSKDNSEAILDLLNSLYNKDNYISICASDLMHIMNNNTFNQYDYFINEQITINNIFNEVKTNKSNILIYYCDEDKCDIELSIISELLKKRQNESWIYSLIVKNDYNHDRKLSIFVEK